MILIENLHKSFEAWGGLRKPIIQNLDLKLGGGAFYHIVGPNGCGKSTLLNLICGGILPDKGRILLKGRDLTEISWRERSRIIGMVTQDPLESLFPELTLAENIILVRSTTDNHSIDPFGRLAKQDNLVWLEHHFPQLIPFYDRPVELMSGGELQLSSLAIALIGEPQILLLDEFISALSAENKVLAMSRVRDFLLKDRLVLATFHGTINIPGHTVRVITMPGDGSATLISSE